jgi:hypothetical protein
MHLDLNTVVAWLQPTALISSFIAAFFWFWSAARRFPSMQIGYGGAVSKDDPLLVALVTAARLNRWAALFTGITISAMALSSTIPPEMVGR